MSQIHHRLFFYVFCRLLPVWRKQAAHGGAAREKSGQPAKSHVLI
jgi:hypothetical protein